MTLQSSLPVLSYTEWDPLEEAIVGVLDGATVPPWDPMLQLTMPQDQWELFRNHGGQPFPAEAIEAGRRELEEFVRLLAGEGVRVRRPEPFDFARSCATPEWESTGLYAAMPRDLLLVVGDEIIECPLAWRSRAFEADAYRPLLVEYFRRGARWSAAPRPRLTDAQFDPTALAAEGADEPAFHSYVTELEPVFDAADFVRCGRDLFVQRSHVTNSLGIEWLRRHLGPEYRIHEIEICDPHPMHIDATFMPLAPGKLLINSERVARVPDLFRGWEVREVPPPAFRATHPLYMCSRWVSMNVLMLDEKRVVVERQEEPLIRLFRDWGLQPIPCSFTSFYPFGGSFHCATLDVRRRGELKSYF
jgi:glycine amidinotransferase